ncbi:hypothetical protein [Piscinibacter gummiphilus]|uniref:Uncharacterized protein n=1 Tax=Piscinibacter gummiphilus TaxID=946333 RepID=A0ABZ0CU96_9BURK|nr:hypothetical protein [Piscinibacter gummiphilus]WOB06507.1 hypothetical protein RXV79_16415 [Piscinibacter gummiphilus]
MSAQHTPGPHILRNPLNGLIWSRHNDHPVSELAGDYTVYSSAHHATQALRRNRKLLDAGFVVEPEPAHQRGEYVAKLRAFQSGYGRLGGNCADAEWNAFSEGWDFRAAIAKAGGAS